MFIRRASRYLPLTRKIADLNSSAEAHSPGHIPVMTDEVIEHLNLKDGDTFLDMTFGGGGHSKALLARYPNLKIIALDRDPFAHEMAKDLERKHPGQVIPLLGRFSELPERARENDIEYESVDGILFDLGASSMQMDSPNRGFGVSQNGPLDMRMDGDRFPDSLTAADVINYGREQDLHKIIKTYGEDKHSRLIARVIVQARVTFTKFKTTKDLVDLIDLVINKPGVDKIKRRSHPGTKVFQALRIFVNNELNELNHGLILANYFLKTGGRVAVLSFHSLEDRIVKTHFQGHTLGGTGAILPKFKHFGVSVDDNEMKKVMLKPWCVVNKKVIVPTEEEVEQNPRCRSAKLRVAIKENLIVLPEYVRGTEAETKTVQ